MACPLVAKDGDLPYRGHNPRHRFVARVDNPRINFHSLPPGHVGVCLIRQQARYELWRAIQEGGGIDSLENVVLQSRFRLRVVGGKDLSLLAGESAIGRRKN